MRKGSSSWGNVMKRRTFLHLAAGASALPSLPRIAAAADAYPSRAIYVIVGFTPGAAADVTARLLGDGLGRILGQQIVVESRPGAGSSIAADYVAHAPRDGYMLYLSTLSIIANQLINPNPSFDLVRDLAPITLLSSGAVVLVVNPDVRVYSVAEPRACEGEAGRSPARHGERQPATPRKRAVRSARRYQAPTGTVSRQSADGH